MSTPLRIIGYSWKNFFRNAWIGAATIFAFTMALVSVDVLLGFQALLDRAATSLEDRVDVTVSFKTAAPEATLSQMRFYLLSLPQVKTAQLISAEESLAAFRRRHAQDPKILAALSEVGGNPLGAQLIVKAQHTEDYPFILQAIQGPQYAPYIQKQTYDDHRLAIARIQTITREARILGAALVAVFALFGLLIIFNAVRVGVYTQREEIAIMRLVGASSTFIRAPFILEGVWFGIISLVLASAGAFGALLWLDPLLRPVMDGDTGLRHFFVTQGPWIVLVQALSLIALTAMVSWAAVGRYIKR